LVLEQSIRRPTPARVVHLTSVHPRNDIRIFLKECRSLAVAGFEVFLVVADGQGAAFVEGVQIIDVGARAGARLGRAALTAARVYAAARGLHADIYHFHDPELLPWGALLRLSGARVVYDAHEHLPEDILTKHYLPSYVRTPLSFLADHGERLAARALSAIVAAYPHIERRFEGVAVPRVSICNYPLPEELQRASNWQERRLQACYIGGISINRGVRELAAAAALCRTQIVLAGPLWDRLTLEQARALPGWQRISYRGVISRAEVADLMGSSRVGIVTFLPTVSHVNAHPNKLFEYMSAGIPVVASDFPSWREIVAATGSGLCVDPRDPAAIAAAIDRLAADPEFAASCGRNGAQAVAREYNWSTQANELVRLYLKLQQQREQTAGL
jgi:glycosyltransferase involved in cell wall biosynthesis